MNDLPQLTSEHAVLNNEVNYLIRAVSFQQNPPTLVVTNKDGKYFFFEVYEVLKEAIGHILRNRSMASYEELVGFTLKHVVRRPDLNKPDFYYAWEIIPPAS